jgi:lysyl-tRNA synthetase class 2
MSRFHNPEFTAIELYRAWWDYRVMADFVEEMLRKVVEATTGSLQVQLGEHTVDFAQPFARLTMYGAIAQYTGEQVDDLDEAGLRDVCAKLGVKVDATMGRGKLIDELFGTFVEPKLIAPTFIMDYPIEMSPLAKKHRDKPGLVERFELICNGKEIANAYSELNDPLDQRRRFEEQLALADRGDDEAMPLDEDFLRALEYGMPPTSGLGIGIDRLAMILTQQNSIQEVLLFPQLRPETLPDVAPKAAFQALGIPAEWLPIVVKAGFRHPSDLHGKQAGQVHNTLNTWQRKLSLTLPELSREAVQSWIDTAPVPEA